MSAFKPGDRISFPVYDQRFRGTVKAVNHDGSLQVKLDIPNGQYYLTVNNPGQVRKIKRKPKAEGRRIWIGTGALETLARNGSCLAGISGVDLGDTERLVEFVEVRRRK